MLPNCRTLVFAFLAVTASETLAGDPQAPAVKKPEDAQARAEWIYFSDSGEEGRFIKGNGREWIEKTTDGGQNRFLESGRNAEFVELVDRGRLIVVRLYDDHADLRQGTQSLDFGVLYDGHWASADVELTPDQKKLPKGATRWEYKIIVPSSDPKQTEKTLNELGVKGWELSVVDSRVSGQIVTGPDGLPHVADTTSIQLILKRPKRAAAHWEYKVLVSSTDSDQAEKALNKLGEAGWELNLPVGKMTGQMVKGPDGLPHVVNNTTVQLILKRLKGE
jgi:hypothetical protein